MCIRSFVNSHNFLRYHLDHECPGQAIGVRCKLENGLTGFIHVKYISDKPVSNPADRVKPGMPVYCRVIKVPLSSSLLIPCPIPIPLPPRWTRSGSKWTSPADPPTFSTGRTCSGPPRLVFSLIRDPRDTLTSDRRCICAHERSHELCSLKRPKVIARFSRTFFPT